VPVADTLKQIDEAGRVVQTVDRATVRAIQTPQAFAGDLLRRAHATVTNDVTDDAAMIEAVGEPVFVVEGDPANLKVTRPIDLELARSLLATRQD
jgi:2-C-methyl-D-erythritol 4-phosphate cytidylyltransferase